MSTDEMTPGTPARAAWLRERDAETAVRMFGYRWVIAPNIGLSRRLLACLKKNDDDTYGDIRIIADAIVDVTDDPNIMTYTRFVDWDNDVPRFTTDLVASRRVWMQMRDIGYLVVVKEMPPGKVFRTNDTGSDLPGVSAVCQLIPSREPLPSSTIYGYSDTIEAAICDAAIRFLEQRK